MFFLKSAVGPELLLEISQFYQKQYKKIQRLGILTFSLRSTSCLGLVLKMFLDWTNCLHVNNAEWVHRTKHWDMPHSTSCSLCVMSPKQLLFCMRGHDRELWIGSCWRCPWCCGSTWRRHISLLFYLAHSPHVWYTPEVRAWNTQQWNLKHTVQICTSGSVARGKETGCNKQPDFSLRFPCSCGSFLAQPRVCWLTEVHIASYSYFSTTLILFLQLPSSSGSRTATQD